MAWEKTKEQKELEAKMLAKLIKRGASNNNPVDELSKNCRRYVKLKEQIDKLNAEYSALNSYIKSKVTQRGETLLVQDVKDANVNYTLIIKAGHQTKLDTTKAKSFLSDEQIAECSYTINTESLSIKEVAKVA